jgi:hypothetical protein
LDLLEPLLVFLRLVLVLLLQLLGLWLVVWSNLVLKLTQLQK